MIVIVYLLSDMAILVPKKQTDKEIMRIIYDKYSHVEVAGDGELFKNRVYFYGKKLCIHLTFSDRSVRDDFTTVLTKQITEMNKNETTRE